MTYDALDPELHTVLGNGVAVSHVYDLAGRETARQFTSPAGVMLAAFTSTYDAVGNRLSLAEMQVVSGVTQALVTSYTYDSGDQLLSETASGSALNSLTDDNKP